MGMNGGDDDWIDARGWNDEAPVAPPALEPSRAPASIVCCPVCKSLEIRVRSCGDNRPARLECLICPATWKEDAVKYIKVYIAQ
jgi:hypothetical protein